MFDSTMSMEQQVNAVCRSGYGQLRKIGRIRSYLSSEHGEATKSLVNGLVTSRIDYCNALLHGLSNTLIGKLQRVQNTAARIITRTSRHSHITPVLKELHWHLCCIGYNTRHCMSIHTMKYTIAHLSTSKTCLAYIDPPEH